MKQILIVLGFMLNLFVGVLILCSVKDIQFPCNPFSENKEAEVEKTDIDSFFDFIELVGHIDKAKKRGYAQEGDPELREQAKRLALEALEKIEKESKCPKYIIKDLREVYEKLD